jgi:hypothetical protein
MIDTQTGRICFDSGFTVTPLTVIDDIAGFVDFEKDKVLENGPWKTYSIRNMSLCGRPISLSISFEDNRIRSLHMSCASGSESWADYSTAKEFEIKAANDRLLEDILGMKPSQCFWWGIVESSFDSKTGDAGIVIRYGS